MQPDQRNIKVRVDAYTRVCLTAIAMLLTVVVLGLWADLGRLGPRAVAQEPVSRENRYVPRSTLDLSDLLAETRQTNQKLDRIIRLLEDGQAKVQVVDQAAAQTQPEVPNGVIKIVPQPQQQ
jgi:hypothetical protein